MKRYTRANHRISLATFLTAIALSSAAAVVVAAPHSAQHSGTVGGTIVSAAAGQSLGTQSSVPGGQPWG
jgi:hypothetical protein